MLNDEGNYLSHSDAEPIQLKKPLNRKLGGANKQSPSGKNHLRNAGQAILSDENHNMNIDYQQEMKQGVSKIMVAVRLRPMWKKEKDKGEMNIVKILDRNVVILLDPADVLAEEKVLGKNRTKEKQYAFDYAFDEKTPQLEIFKNTTQFLCEGCLNGYNSTVFAYGSTGAGKTYTMLGNEQNPGIMFNTMKEVFKHMKKHQVDRDYTIRVSFLEIYNENIKDLIMVSNDVLDLREDPIKGVQVAGLSEIEVHTPDEIFELLIYGNRNRTQEATGANETSSRSHAVLQIICEFRDKDSGIKSEIKIGKLSLIDLAGSERAAKTGNRGIRMIEGANINKSLLALANCINMLHENHSKGQSNYIPFRDSKLTRLLKDSLGGNCRTVMIANIAPSSSNYEDTHNTLKYANRAKNIKTNVQRNVLNVEYHVSQYTDIINQLKLEIQGLKTKLGQSSGTPSPQLGLKLSEDVQPSRSHRDISIKDIQAYRDSLKRHFKEEFKAKSQINMLEKDLENNNMSLQNKKAELNKILKDKGNGNIQIKIINEEIDEANQKIGVLKQKVSDELGKFNDMENQRNQLQSQWQNDKSLHELHVEVLDLMLRESSQIVENMDYDIRSQKMDVRMKFKDNQINLLKEQIIFRDEMIDEARRMLKSSGMNTEVLRDKRIIDVDDIIYDFRDNQNGSQMRNYQQQNARVSQQSVSPRRGNQNYMSNQYGSNRKQLNTYVDKQERLDAINGRNNGQQNFPSNPSNQRESLLQRNSSENRLNSYNKQFNNQQNQKSSNLPVALNKYQMNGNNNGSSSTKNLNSRQNQLNSASRQNQYSKVSLSKNNRLNKYDKNINNAKAYLQGPIRDRNGYVLPSSLQNNGGRSYLASPNRGRNNGEEQKRANSVASGDTIISTASSNSPLKRRPLQMKKNLQSNGLQITGQGQYNKRGGPLSNYQQYGKRQSPYINKAGPRGNSNMRGQTGASNTDSELYGNGASSIHARPGPTGIGAGSRNVSLSLAQRQQERKEKEKQILKEVESQKRAVLDKLNKIQSKKFSQTNV